jgi:hypothetical protein
MAFHVLFGHEIREFQLPPEDTNRFFSRSARIAVNVEKMIREEFKIDKKLPILVKPLLGQKDDKWQDARYFDFLAGMPYVVRGFDLDDTLPVTSSSGRLCAVSETI